MTSRRTVARRPASPRGVCSHTPPTNCLIFFFFNDTATTEIYTLSLHDALPIFVRLLESAAADRADSGEKARGIDHPRSEEHTSELQSPCNLVCRLLLEKKKK